MTKTSDPIENLTEDIRLAFDDRLPPTDEELLHPDCHDDVDILQFYGGVYWQDMDDAMIVYNYAAPTAFSPKAYRYYLPAYLNWMLQNPDSIEYVSEAFLISLDPGTSSEMLHQFRKSKFQLLTSEQKQMIKRFLNHFAAHGDLAELAENALKNYWAEV